MIHLGDLVKVISKSKRNIFPVVDELISLKELCLLDDVREIMFKNELYDITSIRDLMTIPPSYLDVKENIETVMETSVKQMHGIFLFWIKDIMSVLFQNQGFMQHTVNCSFSFQKNRKIFCTS